MDEAGRGSEEMEEQAGEAAPPKKKRDRKTIKTMTKEERQRYSKEHKEERKAKAQKCKKEQEEKEQEKARLKREAHKEVLKIAKEMSSKTAATSTVERAEDVSVPLATPAEPSTSQQDPLETSLVQTSPQLVSLIPFEESEEEIIRPTSTGAARVLSQTISIEGSVPKPQKVIAGKEPRPTGLKSAGPKSVGQKSAGPKPTGSKLIARKESKSTGPKSTGLMPASVKPVGDRPPRPIVGGKVPRKQVVPPKKKSRPGSGSLNYVPTCRDF